MEAMLSNDESLFEENRRLLTEREAIETQLIEAKRLYQQALFQIDELLKKEKEREEEREKEKVKLNEQPNEEDSEEGSDNDNPELSDSHQNNVDKNDINGKDEEAEVSTGDDSKSEDEKSSKSGGNVSAAEAAVLKESYEQLTAQLDALNSKLRVFEVKCELMAHKIDDEEQGWLKKQKKYETEIEELKGLNADLESTLKSERKKGLEKLLTGSTAIKTRSRANSNASDT